MKDFAKSIYVGNAKDKNGTELKVGDIVAVKTSDPSLNHGKIVRISGDQISVDVTGDNDIWTTPARLAVKMGNSKVGNKKIKGSYVTIDTSTGRVTFDDFAGKSFDVSRIDSSAGYELRVMQQQINDFKKALEEAKSLAKQNGLI